jgi:hypothetical protein
MINYIQPALLFIFVYSVMAILRFIINFIIAMLSTPPKRVEVSLLETSVYGLFLSYIITYLIFL